jgi:hypothetical protein
MGVRMFLWVGSYHHNVSACRSRKESISLRSTRRNCCKGKPGMLYDRSMQTVECKASTPPIYWSTKRNGQNAPRYPHFRLAQPTMYSPKSCFPIDMKTLDSLYPIPTPSNPGTAHKQDGRWKPGARNAGRALGVTLSPVAVVGLCRKVVKNL